MVKFYNLYYYIDIKINIFKFKLTIGNEVPYFYGKNFTIYTII